MLFCEALSIENFITGTGLRSDGRVGSNNYLVVAFLILTGADHGEEIKRI